MTAVKLDQTFARDIKRQANGDGSREARFAFKQKVERARKDLSSPFVATNFCECIRKHGRVPVAICVAETIIERRHQLRDRSYQWAEEVMRLYVNAPADKMFAYIDDNLHPTRIEEYAGSFMRVTIEEPRQ